MKLNHMINCDGTSLHSILCLLVAAALVSLSSVQTTAQEIPEGKRATLVFDLNVERMLQNEFIQALGSETIEFISNIDSTLPPGCDLNDLTRFCGAFQLSGEFEELESFNFHFQLHFTSAETVQEIKKQLPNFADNTFENNGKTFYSPEPNIYALFEGKMLEIGSKQYMLHPNRNLMVESLVQPWQALPPEAAVKVVFDMKASQKIIKGARNSLANEISFNPTVRSIVSTTLEVIEDIDMLVAYADLDMPELLSLRFTPKKGSSEKVKGVVDGALFLTAISLKNLINAIPDQSERGSKMLLAMTDQLSAKEIQGQIEVKVVKPDSLSSVIRDDYLPGLMMQVQDQQIRQNLIALSRGIFTFKNNDQLPFLKTDEDDWNDNLSWRVRILPRLYQHRANTLARISDTAQNWKHESNQKLIDRMPRQFGDNRHNSNIVWVKSKAKNLTDITDGYQDTISLIRLSAPSEYSWIQPEGDNISILSAIKMISELPDGEELYAVTYGSSIIKLNNTLTHQQLKAYFTPAGAEDSQKQP
ncbi:hypothetical protein OAG68_01855 [bacterium]|nr:hypothetical protein [bacterium]